MTDPAGRASGDAIEIVGVVDNVRALDVDEGAPPRVYRPLGHGPLTSVALAVRTSGDPAALAAPVREVLRQTDRGLAIAELQTFPSQLARFRRTYDLIIGMFAGFAAIGLVVAIAGVYGVTSFSAGQRRHELGVRMALGANTRSVLGLVLGGTA